MKQSVNDSPQVETQMQNSFNLFSGQNHCVYFGMFSHRIIVQQQLDTGPLGVRYFGEVYTAENQTSYCWRLVCNAEVQYIIGIFTMDNISNSDTTPIHIPLYLDISNNLTFSLKYQGVPSGTDGSDGTLYDLTEDYNLSVGQETGRIV